MGKTRRKGTSGSGKRTKKKRASKARRRRYAKNKEGGVKFVKFTSRVGPKESVIKSWNKKNIAVRKLARKLSGYR
jgi:hypothetical protein